MATTKSIKNIIFYQLSTSHIYTQEKQHAIPNYERERPGQRTVSAKLELLDQDLQ